MCCTFPQFLIYIAYFWNLGWGGGGGLGGPCLYICPCKRWWFTLILYIIVKKAALFPSPQGFYWGSSILSSVVWWAALCSSLCAPLLSQYLVSFIFGRWFFSSPLYWIPLSNFASCYGDLLTLLLDLSPPFVLLPRE